jgi:hypothetical protein
MILVRLTGGLGNQLFQYALGTYLAQKNNTVLKLDLTLLEDRTKAHELVTHRNFDLDVFQLPIELASLAEITHFNGRSYPHLPGKLYNKLRWKLVVEKRLVIERKRNYQPEIMNLPDDRCLVGAWQSERYFLPIAEKIRTFYSFPEILPEISRALGSQINGRNSLCVNVRRGDLVTSPLYKQTLGAMPVAYFQKGFETISALEKIESVFVFSDDAQWAQENLKFPVPTIFVGPEHNGPKYFTKLHLMSLCHHFLIPNSTFSWWAAWLSNHPGKRVVAPLKWFRDPSLDGTDIVPESWIRI